mmetsp:Transcript_3528/g.5137  ORF Transcript_3528/g.5137 Transcript_3528/m.5137 type:complete len:243 (+) Transcript_3528:179-907(+)
MTLCAACGIGEDDGIKMNKCTACDLARYCSDKCQLEHLPEHEQTCKKRAAELRDDILFKQPESSYLGDCPICFLPLSIHASKSTMMACCSKIICNGCNVADQIRQLKEAQVRKCPYCRHQLPQSQEEAAQIRMKRVEVNDPVAIWRLGVRCRREGDYESAFQHYKKAAELGNADAHYNVSCVYRDGEGVEKDKKKEVYHLEEAAIGGHLGARYNLGNHECRNSRHDRAAKHYIIAANSEKGF